MPQLKTRTSARPRDKDESPKVASKQPTPADARDLIGRMLDYEATAKQNGLNLASGRFEMLTASERQFLRAELVADYIRLSAGNMGNTPGYYDATIESFCSKICDLRIPSHELMGTYLAAVEVVSTEDRLNQIPELGESVRRTMLSVLEACVEVMRRRTEQAHASV